MDSCDCARHRRSGLDDVAAVNGAILAAVCGVYILLRAADPGTLHPLVRFHAADFFATPALLSVANLLTIATPFRGAFSRPTLAMVVVICAVVEWELVAPLYTTATGDWLDVPAYLGGAIAYLAVLRTAAAFRNRTVPGEHGSQQSRAGQPYGARDLSRVQDEQRQ
jgi:uncharacterized membrane protein